MKRAPTPRSRHIPPTPEEVQAQRDVLLRALELAEPIIDRYHSVMGGCANVQRVVREALYQGQRTSRDVRR